MEKPRTTGDADVLLRSFLDEGNSSHAEKLLEELICEQADPIITAIIRNKLRATLVPSQGGAQNQDALELAGDVHALLVGELRHLKAGPEARTINSFRSYVAIKTYSACADYFRKKHPLRWRLKDMLRYHLKQSERFALWQGDGGRWFCGLRTWMDARSACSPPRGLEGLCESVDSAEGFVAAVFEKIAQPLELDHLVALAAEAWHIQDRPADSYDHNPALLESIADPQAAVDVTLQDRLYLARLWVEVCSLPALQRMALLLNLRDAQGGSVIAYLPYLGIASKDEIAELVSMPEDRLASLWNELPLEDANIAQLLGITRQQVINLRRTARDRLARRMKALEEKPPISGASR